MKPGILAGWMLALLAVTTSGAVMAAPATSASRMQALSITSDRLEMDDKNQVAIFSGHVVADDGRMRLNADRMTVRYDKRMKGNGGVREVKAEGRVTIQQDRDHGTADVALYQVEKRVVELTGIERDATVRRGDDQLTGKRILVTLNTQQRIDKVSVQGGENRRVSARITPSGVVGEAPRSGKDAASSGAEPSGTPPSAGLALTREKMSLPAPGQTPGATESPSGAIATGGAKRATGELNERPTRIPSAGVTPSAESPGDASAREKTESESGAVQRQESAPSPNAVERESGSSEMTLPTPKPRRRVLQPPAARR
ncbi:MAG: lipopolysaccharide transport periplasmic protein LptA [Magnetococcales bacterium]|nr:lipopolysaccharide transport periplasmic protein LptA [Magnetococcales bacterium]